jgi:hypothetical protein
MGKVIEFKPRTAAAHNAELTGSYQFTEKPVAKSSSCTLMATACQLCGHKRDGRKNASLGPDGKACKCGCHEGA